MNESDTQELLAILAWSTKNYKIPSGFLDDDGNKVSCLGSISESKITINCKNFSCSVNRSEKFGNVNNPEEQYNHAKCSDGALIQCNLDYQGNIISGIGLINSPNGKISTSLSSNSATTTLFSSSKKLTFI